MSENAQNTLAEISRVSVEKARPWQITALCGTVFCLAVCLVMGYVRFTAENPLSSPKLATLKEQLSANPKDETLKDSIRQLDLRLRRQYFFQIRLNQLGASLAAFGFLTFLLATRQARKLQQPDFIFPKNAPMNADGLNRLAAANRLAVTIVGGVAVIALAVVAVSGRTGLPKSTGDLEKVLASENKPILDCASKDELRKGWPRFRGSEGNGVALDSAVKLDWDVKSGAGIVWKSEIPAIGFNSPIIWGGKAFLSGGDARRREVFCFSLEKGELLWRQAIQASAPTVASVPEIPEQTGYAASTMATDGRRVYVIFANGDLAALSLGGQVLWSKNLSIAKNPHGHASSLVTIDERLIVLLDQGETGSNDSRLFAFHGPTGKVLWQQNRPVGTSWATPLVIEQQGKPQIITLGVPWVIAYGASDGSEIWRVEGLSNEVTPSPIFADGLVLVISPNEKLMAVRPDGRGDVTKTHVLWSSEDAIPDISTPTATNELLWLTTTAGMLTCYEVKTGKKVWEHDLAMECHASPTLVGSKLLILGTKGAGFVLDAGREFKELARNETGEKVFASPAVVGDRILVRGVQHLFCIGAASATVARSN